MTTLQIENLPDELYESIQSLADDRQMSLSEAVIYLLHQAVQPIGIEEKQSESMSQVLRRIRDRVDPTEFGLADSTVLIREDRGTKSTHMD